ncbi:MAG: hypothetical protein M0Q92_05065 [Methanoregula sp.]|jgi:hypothetical protein|nr:hypothetical protein [Methanoregula sp.]
MTVSQKISPVIIVSGLVIFLNIFFLISYSPILYQVQTILNPHEPDAICLYPPAEEKTMSAIWDIIVTRTGIDNSSAVFHTMQVTLTPDETIEDLQVSFYATKDGDGRMVTAYLRYDPENCGTLNIQSSPSVKPEFATWNTVSPREFLMELPQVRLSGMGIPNQTASISTGVNWQKNIRYDSLPCVDLFLLDNRTMIPLREMLFDNTLYAGTHWTIHPMRCITIPEGGGSCSSEQSILVFSETRISGADFVRKTTGNDQPVKLNECYHSTTQARSCKTTILGTSCTNWTEY